jgi:SMI1-KNR4 cell-wall
MENKLQLLFPSLVLGGGLAVSDIQIANAEYLLNIKFPADYFEYLKIFGWLEVDHYEFFGLGENIPKFLNLELIAPQEWETGDLSKNLLPIWNNGGGDLYCIDLKLSDKKVSTISVFSNGDRQSEIVEIGFEKWLTKMLSTLIEV